jgi:hypothetical protein
MEPKTSIETTVNLLVGPPLVRLAEENQPHLMVDDTTPWEELERELKRIKERYE